MDTSILLAINAFMGSSPIFDSLVYHISDNPLFKGIATMMIIWSLWFANGADPRRRSLLVSALIVGAFSALAARAGALLLPSSERPIHAEVEGLDTPASPDVLRGWSSFPSDHAALFVALGVSVLFASRTGGLVLLAHAFIVICLPRIYLGLHWPSDIVGGAVLGAVVAGLATVPVARLCDRMELPRLVTEYPAVAYPALFLVTTQAALLFNNARAFLSFLARVAQLS